MSDSSDEYLEEDNLSKKCFDVKIPEHFNPNMCPSTGEEYLQLAMYESKYYCKSIVRASIDSKKLKLQTVGYIKDNLEQACQKILLPSSWRDEKVYEFARFHKYIEKILLENPLKHKAFLPDDWNNKIQELPTFSEAIKLDAFNQLCLLEMISNRLHNIKPGSTIPDIMARWIFTILGLLEIPLEPSMYGILRQLAKQFSEIRAKLGADVNLDAYANLNLFICIIGVYYKQFDVADNYTV